MTRKLHIGGTISAPGWEVLNVMPGPHVDHICDAAELSIFEDNSFSVVYASHILEHMDFVEEISNALAEWYRVLEPSGKVYISVPDLDVLSELFLDKQNLPLDDRFQVMRMIFGGHTDDYDYHMIGLNEEFLTEYLKAAGFGSMQKVDVFDLFQDTSTMVFHDVLISLNMIAEKPG